MDVHTEHVTLHLLSFEETERILRRNPRAGDVWASGYPSIEQVDFLQAYLVELRTARAGTHWQAQLRRRSDDLVIGGAGVTGPPDARGAVTIGFEIDPSLPDEPYGHEIVLALLDVARDMEARRVTTSTRSDDPGRQDSYRRAGLIETSRTVDGVSFAIDLA